jgi:hypothetical protein
VLSLDSSDQRSGAWEKRPGFQEMPLDIVNALPLP